jgi:CRISPR/Cas system endoribonuclease Cas6 (RAMP superfamily)
MSFCIKFSSNISLLYFMGLGKNAALGFGVLKEQKNEDSNFC